MTLYSYGFENGTDEVGYTIDATVVVAPIVADGAQAAHGNLALRTDNSTGYQFVQKDLSATVTDAAARFYIYEDTAVTSNSEFFRFQASTTTIANPDRAVSITLQGTNKLRIIDNTGAAIWTSASALAASTWYRVEVRVQCGVSANATISGGYYIGDSAIATEVFNLTTATTTATVVSARLGKTSVGSTSPTTGHIWVDDWAIEDAPTGLIGPYDGSNTVPVADAGSDQADIRSYATVQLDGTGSSDADMDTLTYAWTQTAGSTVTLDDTASSTPSFTAPATTMGATLTFQLVVNDGQADSAPDTVNVAVSPHELWQIVEPATPVLAPIKTTRIS